MFGSLSASESCQRDKAESLRIRDLEIEIGDAKLIEAEAAAVMQQAKQKLLALAIALSIKTGADVSGFSETIDDYFSDMRGDTFGLIRSKMEDRL